MFTVKESGLHQKKLPNIQYVKVLLSFKRSVANTQSIFLTEKFIVTQIHKFLNGKNVLIPLYDRQRD